MLYLTTDLVAHELSVPTLSDTHRDVLELFNREVARFKIVDDYNGLTSALNYFKIPYKLVVSHPKYPDPDGALLESKENIIDFRSLQDLLNINRANESNVNKTMEEMGVSLESQELGDGVEYDEDEEIL